MKNEQTIAEIAAREAGDIILRYYKSKYEIRNKSYKNPVTTADHASDAFLKERLLSEFPDYGWLSEETVDSPERMSKERVWVVDPLDGTKEFIEGVPHFVVSIALIENGEPIVGVLYNPVKKELFSAQKGKGATLNGNDISCSQETNPILSVVLNSRSETKRGLWNIYRNQFKELKPIGSVAYKLGLTAANETDLFVSVRPKNEWDICAGHCIVNESGAMLINLNGSEIIYNKKNLLITPGIIAGNPTLVRKSQKIFQ